MNEPNVPVTAAGIDCAPIAELIGPWVDGDLPSEVKRRVEAHLLGCQNCAWEAQTQRIARERLREHASVEVMASDAFRARTLARLRAGNPHLTTPAGYASDEPEQYRLPMGI